MSERAARVRLRLPSVLEVMVGTTRAEVRGATVAEALESAYDQLPELRRHLTLDTGGLRPHVLCLVNGVALPREQALTTELSEGDELSIHQAISGG